METEIRFYYSSDSKDKIIKYLRKYKELHYKGRFYEKTDQYNHPMKKYDYYSLDIDGRFRIRRTVKGNYAKCMITWKRRLKDNKDSLIHKEEEVEITIKNEEYDNLIFLVENVLHLNIVESYERYRNVFTNEDIEIVVDEYPFGIAVEIENKSKIKNVEEVIKDWVSKLNFDLNKAYRLSWDDKYNELCKSQNIPISNVVRFNANMPKILDDFDR